MVPLVSLLVLRQNPAVAKMVFVSVHVLQELTLIVAATAVQRVTQHAQNVRVLGPVTAWRVPQASISKIMGPEVKSV